MRENRLRHLWQAGQTAINGWLQNMAIRASGDEGIKDWMDVGVFGYRTDQQANPIIQSALQGPLANRALVSITEIVSLFALAT